MREDDTEKFDAGFHDGVGALVQFAIDGELVEVGEGQARDGVVGSQGDRGVVSDEPVGKRECRAGRRRKWWSTPSSKRRV
ncbi:hypothetical protein ACFQZ4_05125 [Catellatospora coxensis]